MAEAVLQNIITKIEESVDEEIQKLDSFDGPSLERLREKRLEEMRKERERTKEWLAKGHGEYNEIEEREFFSICKSSPELVVHFYKRDVPRCKIFDHHLKILAPKHLEARFIKINAENAPFLAERLKIKFIPTLMLAVGGKTKDFVIGFEDLGCRDDFTTEMLECRLGASGVIKYEGDLLVTQLGAMKKRPQQIIRGSKRTIRDDSSSECSD